MIRINLLAVERERGKRGALIPAAHRITIAASLVLLSATLVIGWWFWSLRQASIRVDADITKAELDTKQLRSVLMQVQKFETRKAQLQQRVSLIEELRRGQTGPVHVLDEISKAMPDRLWLTDLSQKDNQFKIDGMTTSLQELSSFVANLEASRWFKKPVDIVDSQSQTDKGGGSEIFKFSVRASFADPDAPAPPVVVVAAKGRAGAPPAKSAK
jgi:type IV pilus assembly protein PilN